MFKDIYFWFLQPSSILNQYDWTFMYIFAGMLVASIIFIVFLMFIKHQIYRGAVKRWKNLFLYIGLSGIVWGAFRYENTPIFAKRFWAGALLLGGLVWLVFILKYMFFRFNKDKREYEESLLRNKYIPKPKK